MAQTGYTPISIYYSATATNTPTAGNLVAGELAINTADGKLFYKDSAGAVQVIGTKGGVGTSSTTQVLYNSSGLVVGSANMVFDGSTLTTLNSAYTGTLTGGTGIVNLGSGQFYKNASGNVGIGTTTPNTKLVPLSSTGVPLSSYTNTSAVFQGAYGVGNGGAIGFDCASNSTNYPTGIGYVVTNNAGYTLGDMVFGTRSVTTDTAPTERMRIDSSGNVGIGTNTISAPNGRVYNLQIGTNNAGSSSELLLGHQGDGFSLFTSGGSGAGALSFSQGTSEKMRIVANGDVYIGTTATFSYANGLLCVNANGGGNPCIVAGVNSTSSAYNNIVLGNSTGGVGRIQTNGSSTTYLTSSDHRLKSNATPIQNAISTIEKLNPVTFTWNVDSREDAGFLAHEFQEVLPNYADGTKDGVDAEGKPMYQAVDKSGVIPFLVKAIQELNAKVDAQAVEIATLKAK